MPVARKHKEGRSIVLTPCVWTFQRHPTGHCGKQDAGVVGPVVQSRRDALMFLYRSGNPGCIWVSEIYVQTWCQVLQGWALVEGPSLSKSPPNYPMNSQDQCPQWHPLHPQRAEGAPFQCSDLLSAPNSLILSISMSPHYVLLLQETVV